MISCSVDFVVAGVDSSGVIEWTELGNTKHTKAFIFCHSKLPCQTRGTFYRHKWNAPNVRLQVFWNYKTTNRKTWDEFHFACKWGMELLGRYISDRKLHRNYQKLHKKLARKKWQVPQVYDNKEEMKLRTRMKKLYQDYLFF